MKVAFALLAIGLAVSGCAYRPGDVADPEAITLRKAVFDVADTLYEVKQHTKNRDKVGLYVDSATVVFNISSKATETDSLKVDASAPKILGLGVTANAQLVDESNRGNQITIVFKNIAGSGLSDAQKQACLKNPKAPGCPVIMMKPN